MYRTDLLRVPIFLYSQVFWTMSSLTKMVADSTQADVEKPKAKKRRKDSGSKKDKESKKSKKAQKKSRKVCICEKVRCNVAGWSARITTMGRFEFSWFIHKQLFWWTVELPPVVYYRQGAPHTAMERMTILYLCMTSMNDDRSWHYQCKLSVRERQKQTRRDCVGRSGGDCDECLVFCRRPCARWWDFFDAIMRITIGHRNCFRRSNMTDDTRRIIRGTQSFVFRPVMDCVRYWSASTVSTDQNDGQTSVSEIAVWMIPDVIRYWQLFILECALQNDSEHICHDAPRQMFLNRTGVRFV